MKKLLKKYSTLFKYFISYFIILIIIYSGIYYIVNYELYSKFVKTYDDQLTSNLGNLSNSIKNQFSRIMQIDLSLSSNIKMINSRYQTNGYQLSEAYNELKKYIAGNPIIDDIIYFDYDMHRIIYTKGLITVADDTLIIADANDNKVYFPYKSILEESSYNSLLSISGETSNVLIYIPKQNSPNYLSVFLINKQELLSMLNSVLLPSTKNVSLIDAKNNVILSSNEENIQPILDSEKDAKTKNDQTKLTIKSCTFPHLSIVAVSDNKTVTEMIHGIFSNTYRLLLIIFLIGVFCCFVVLFITYVPLHKFSKEIMSIMRYNNSAKDQTADIDLKYMTNLFNDINYKNQLLLQKIQDYRLFMQKSILTSVLYKQANSPVAISSIENLFQSEIPNSFFVVHAVLSNSSKIEEFRDALLNCLPKDATHLQLELESQSMSYLVCCPRDEIHEASALPSLFTSLKSNYPCEVYTSGLSDSAMDTARLYDAALHAIQSNNKKKEVYLGIPSHALDDDIDSLYPYQLLDCIVMQTESMDFTSAIHTVHELFDSINVTTYPDFFIRCILLDSLTLIVSFIDKISVPFDSFSELYYKTLYLCRSGKFSKTKDEILRAFVSLLQTFQNETSMPVINEKRVNEYIMEHYLDSSFSILQMGEYFHVTGAYISFWFKKNLKTNISDYVWQLRFDHSCELMKQPNLTIKEISKMVGYENYTSFRRKFKDFTGLSPSEYRVQQGKSE